jgi:hypothetical protein
LIWVASKILRPSDASQAIRNGWNLTGGPLLAVNQFTSAQEKAPPLSDGSGKALGIWKSKNKSSLKQFLC